MNATDHTYYMTLALHLAEQGRFTVSPNPMVGCVIVKNNRIVGQGYHQKAGEAHAEIFALEEAGIEARGASVYVTLEPCCHDGRTPPCTAALIKAGIKNVYIACIDPNPLMDGKSIEILRSAGIRVEVGCCEREAIQLNEIFFYYMKYKRPFVISKWAMSLDGKTRTNKNDDKQISCMQSKEHTHQIRQQVDAVLVGTHTACQDNPLLTSRINKTITKQPIRIILSGHEPLPVDLKIFSDELPAKTIVVVTQQTIKLFKHLQSNNVEILILPENENKQISLSSLLNELGKMQITSLLVEGGMTVHESFFMENLVNKIHIYLSPAFIGTLEKKQFLQINNMTQRGNDFHFIANCKESNHHV